MQIVTEASKVIPAPGAVRPAADRQDHGAFARMLEGLSPAVEGVGGSETPAPAAQGTAIAGAELTTFTAAMTGAAAEGEATPTAEGEADPAATAAVNPPADVLPAILLVQTAANTPVPVADAAASPSGAAPAPTSSGSTGTAPDAAGAPETAPATDGAPESADLAGLLEEAGLTDDAAPVRAALRALLRDATGAAQPVSSPVAAAPEAVQAGPGARRDEAAQSPAPSAASDPAQTTTTAAGGKSAGQEASAGGQSGHGRQGANQSGADGGAAAVAAATTTTEAAPVDTTTGFADLLSTTTDMSAPASTRTDEASVPASLRTAPQAAVQVYTQIVQRADGRSHRFEFRLDPPELGKVEVRLEIGPDKRMQAVVSAQDSGALSDLMRGAKALETALRDSGVELSADGLKFELSGGQNSPREDSQARSQRSSAPVWSSATARADELALAAPLSGAPTIDRWARARLNVVV